MLQGMSHTLRSGDKHKTFPRGNLPTTPWCCPLSERRSRSDLVWQLSMFPAELHSCITIAVFKVLSFVVPQCLGVTQPSSLGRSEVPPSRGRSHSHTVGITKTEQNAPSSSSDIRVDFISPAPSHAAVLMKNKHPLPTHTHTHQSNIRAPRQSQQIIGFVTSF